MSLKSRTLEIDHQHGSQRRTAIPRQESPGVGRHFARTTEAVLLLPAYGSSTLRRSQRCIQLVGESEFLGRCLKFSFLFKNESQVIVGFSRIRSQAHGLAKLCLCTFCFSRLEQGQPQISMGLSA